MDAWDFYASLAPAVRPLRERGPLAALCVIAGTAQGQRETPPLPIHEIAALLDCSERHATRDVQALLSAGLLESVQGDGGRVFMPSAQLLLTYQVFSDVAAIADFLLSSA